MAITSSQVLFKYSVKTGTAGNTTASSAAASLGLYISTTQCLANSINGLFDDISSAENTALTVDYRCVFVHNSSTDTLLSAVVFLSAETAGGANVAIAADTTAISVLGSASAQALTATSETAPGASVTGLTYTSPTTSGSGVALGSIPAGSVKAFWVRRTATNSAALASDSVTFTVSGAY